MHRPALIAMRAAGVPLLLTESEYARASALAESSEPIDERGGCIAWAAQELRERRARNAGH